jgi:rhamnose transport system substrate-binding protein
MNGRALNFALWSFVDTSAISPTTPRIRWRPMPSRRKKGRSSPAGRLGEYTISKDPTCAKGLRVLIDPFSIYDKSNVEAAAK